MIKPLINDVKRSELANALALHDFANSSYDLKGWVDYVVSLFRKYGLEPTRMAVSAPSLKTGKMKTYIREVKKLDSVDNATITGITLQATRHASDDSCWDDIFSVVLSVRDGPVTCILVLDNALVPFNSHIWNNITEDMAHFFKPNYGYGFQRSFKNGPEWYPFGVTSGIEYRSAESELITCWANSYHRQRATYRTGDLRDVYPLNVLSSSHNQRMVENQHLFDWINADSNRGTLTKLSEDLWSWWVEESHIDSVRSALKPTGILLCAP